MIDNTRAWLWDEIRVHFRSKRRIYLLRRWRGLEASLRSLLCGSGGVAALPRSPRPASVLSNEVFLMMDAQADWNHVVCELRRNDFNLISFALDCSGPSSFEQTTEAGGGTGNTYGYLARN
jgi:hypothetical protein